MSLRQEWDILKLELTEEQKHDGRRCFHAGALAVVSMLNPNVETDVGYLHSEEILSLTEEIETVLKYREPK